SSSMSNTLPWRTPATPPMPSDFSAPSMALPCGSRTLGLSVTVMRAFMSVRTAPSRRAARARAGARRRSPFHQNRAGSARRLVLAHDAEPLGDFRVGLQEAAEVAAEAVLVELLVRLDVPQPAGVGRDLVRHHDAHHVVFPQPAAFHLEIDQPDADA